MQSEVPLLEKRVGAFMLGTMYFSGWPASKLTLYKKKLKVQIDSQKTIVIDYNKIDTIKFDV